MKQLMSKSSDNVTVVVRIRPSNEEEQRDAYFTVTQAVSQHMLVFDPKTQPSISLHAARRKNVSQRRYKDLNYAFDYVFGPSSRNEDVFLQSTECVVQGVLDGYNCSVFAYGATGAGKTHTMLGSADEPGVIYHTMVHLYQSINQEKQNKNFDVSVSYCEVYNETVHDLLIPDSGNLPIREDRALGIVISGLSLHKPKSAEELLHMLQFGNENRTQHPTDANAESSRSHAVFQIFVKQRSKAASVNAEVKTAKMCLVDLAGSERAHATKNNGVRFREGANINRSLLALGNVINALASGKKKCHIPYRDSKLTRLLKDSLGGNCRTVMIAAVSPSSKWYDDTYNTLKYANRAKLIRADLKKNVSNVNLHLADYKKYVEELERENRALRAANVHVERGLKPVQNAAGQIFFNIEDLEKKLQDLFKTRREIRRTQMAADGTVRELRWKVSRKEQTVRRVQLLTSSLHVVGKHSRLIQGMKRKIETEESDFESASQHLKLNEVDIQSTYKDALKRAKEAGDCSGVEKTLRLFRADANLHDARASLTFCKKMVRAQERQADVNQKLISSLLSLVKLYHDQVTTQAPHLITQTLKDSYEECCFLVEERGVAWVQGGSPVVPHSNSDSNAETERCTISNVIDISVPCLQVTVGSSPSVAAQHDPIPTAPVRLLRQSKKEMATLNAQYSHGSNASSTNSPRPMAQRVAKPINTVKPTIKPEFSSNLFGSVKEKAGGHFQQYKGSPQVLSRQAESSSLNDTFQVQKPALPNTPIIDSPVPLNSKSIIHTAKPSCLFIAKQSGDLSSGHQITPSKKSESFSSVDDQSKNHSNRNGSQSGPNPGALMQIKSQPSPQCLDPTQASSPVSLGNVSKSPQSSPRSYAEALKSPQWQSRSLSPLQEAASGVGGTQRRVTLVEKSSHHITAPTPRRVSMLTKKVVGTPKRVPLVDKENKPAVMERKGNKALNPTVKTIEVPVEQPSRRLSILTNKVAGTPRRVPITGKENKAAALTTITGTPNEQLLTPRRVPVDGKKRALGDVTNTPEVVSNAVSRSQEKKVLPVHKPRETLEQQKPSPISSPNPMLLQGGLAKPKVTPPVMQLPVSSGADVVHVHEPWKQSAVQGKKNSVRDFRHNRVLNGKPYSMKVQSAAQRVRKTGQIGMAKAPSQPSYMLPTIATARRVDRKEKEKQGRRDVGAVRQPYAPPVSVVSTIPT